MFLLEVGESRIPGAGLGLFSKGDIPKGARIAVITGELITADQFAQRQEKRYGVHWKKGVVLDAADSECMGKWINCADNSRLKSNARLGYDRRNERISVIATKAIPCGAEIIASYDF